MEERMQKTTSNGRSNNRISPRREHKALPQLEKINLFRK
jgi:hypothetical protein